MDYTLAVEGRMHLTFSEANILKTGVGNLSKVSKGDFLYWMEHIIHNTEHPLLKKEAEGLQKKIMLISEAAFEALKEDAISDTIFFPPNYKLPQM